MSEALKRAQRKYYLKTQNKQQERQKKYYQKNKDIILDKLNNRFGLYKRNSKKRNIKFELTIEEFDKLTKNQNCYLCGNFFKYTGIDRVNNKFGYKIGNVLPCCKNCNKSKLDTSLHNYWKQCKDTYFNLKNIFD